MKKKEEFPSREFLDQVFHYLQDEITEISVMEEVEMMRQEQEFED